MNSLKSFLLILLICITSYNSDIISSCWNCCNDDTTIDTSSNAQINRISSTRRINHYRDNQARSFPSDTRIGNGAFTDSNVPSSNHGNNSRSQINPVILTTFSAQQAAESARNIANHDLDTATSHPRLPYLELPIAVQAQSPRLTQNSPYTQTPHINDDDNGDDDNNNPPRFVQRNSNGPQSARGQRVAAEAPRLEMNQLNELRDRVQAEPEYAEQFSRRYRNQKVADLPHTQNNSSGD